MQEPILSCSYQSRCPKAPILTTGETRGHSGIESTQFYFSPPISDSFSPDEILTPGPNFLDYFSLYFFFLLNVKNSGGRGLYSNSSGWQWSACPSTNAVMVLCESSSSLHKTFSRYLMGSCGGLPNFTMGEEGSQSAERSNEFPTGS